MGWLRGCPHGRGRMRLADGVASRRHGPIFRLPARRPDRGATGHRLRLRREHHGIRGVFVAPLDGLPGTGCWERVSCRRPSGEGRSQADLHLWRAASSARRRRQTGSDRQRATRPSRTTDGPLQRGGDVSGSHPLAGGSPDRAWRGPCERRVVGHTRCTPRPRACRGRTPCGAARAAYPRAR